MIPHRGRLGHDCRRIYSYRVLFHQLAPEGQELVRLAFTVRGSAQAPYSGFKVGAAVQSEDTGRIYAGCNVERCTFSSPKPRTPSRTPSIRWSPKRAGESESMPWLS